MNLLFIVNGTKSSADAARAIEFSRRLPSDWNVKVLFRQHKVVSIFTFIIGAITFRPDVVYVVKVAYSGVFAGFIVKCFSRCALICDTGDVAYELAKSSGRYSWLQLQLIKRTEQLALVASDAIVTRGSYHAAMLLEQGVSRVEFIPDGVDLNIERPSEDQSVRSELGLGTDLVVGMVGSMEWSERHAMCYGWDIVEAMAHLRDFPVKALLVGDGDGLEKLQNRAKELGVADRVRFVGRRMGTDLARHLAAMDICISTQSADLVGMVRTTGKLPLYLAHGKYVIATNVGEARNVLPTVGCLLPYDGVRDDGYPQRLSRQVRGLVGKRDSVKVMKSAIELTARNFDYRILAVRVQDLCEGIFNGQRAGSSSVISEAEKRAHHFQQF